MTTDQDVLNTIQFLLDGQEWDSDTLSAIAAVMISAGYQIRDPSEMPDED